MLYYFIKYNTFFWIYYKVFTHISDIFIYILHISEVIFCISHVFLKFFEEFLFLLCIGIFMSESDFIPVGNESGAVSARVFDECREGGV